MPLNGDIFFSEVTTMHVTVFSCMDVDLSLHVHNVRNYCLLWL